ncbi:MAG: monovalent cation/H(+) antiporter subunit G [Caldilineaceae bacterium]
MLIREILILSIATVGVAFMLISAIGILRLPDVYARMHAAGKAATLGVSCVLLATGLAYEAYLVRMIMLITLFFVTAPIATTAMARAAYRTSKPEEKFILRYDDMAQERAQQSDS